jgi:hypothetical protein
VEDNLDDFREFGEGGWTEMEDYTPPVWSDGEDYPQETPDFTEEDLGWVGAIDRKTLTWDNWT